VTDKTGDIKFITRHSTVVAATEAANVTTVLLSLLHLSANAKTSAASVLTTFDYLYQGWICHGSWAV